MSALLPHYDLIVVEEAHNCPWAEDPLSATPLENDYEQLWQELDLFGFGESIEALSSRRGRFSLRISSY